MNAASPAVKLVVFDLDGTLLRGDTVCLALARRLGRTERMLEFEDLTDMSEIEKARYEMADWYRGHGRDEMISMVESGVQVAPGTAEGFALLRAHDVKIGIASMTWEFAVEWFARRFGTRYWTGTRLDFDTWQITHSSATHKADFTRNLMRELDLRPEEVAAVGDSWGDVDMLSVVGRRLFVGKRAPDIPDLVHLPEADILTVAKKMLVSAHPSRAPGKC